MKNSIKILRYLGEDIIAEILGDNEDTIKVKNPLRIVIVPNKMEPGKPSVGFAPFMEWTNDDTFHLRKAMLQCIAEPIPLFVEQYKQQFSNIILPASQILTKDQL